MEKFSKWFNQHYVEITWFTIGILLMGFLDSLAKELYTMAIIDVILIYVNYIMYKRHLQ